MKNNLNLGAELDSNRGREWKSFSGIVEDHVERYTVTQYGDAPDDPVEAWGISDCILAMQKYLNRFGKGMRGPIEQERDLLKVAHFACLAYGKMKGKKA